MMNRTSMKDTDAQKLDELNLTIIVQRLKT